MNLEQLTKTQIILLTLLVSFVTSIATGIVTVTLIDQAPPAVTQTINRVVERTVEQVTSATDGQTAGAGDTVTKEVQVILKESYLVTDAVAIVDESVVRLYTRVQDINGTTVRGQFLGLGLVVSRDGLVVTDATLVSPGNEYFVETKGGALFTASLKNESEKRPTAILALSSKDGGNVALSPISFANVAALKLGETVVTLSGKDRTKVATGIVSDIVSEHLNGDNTEIITVINTSIPDNLVSIGAPIADLIGGVVGMYVVSSENTPQASYIPITTVADQLKEVLDAVGNNSE